MLDSLVGWGNLHAAPDTARVTAVGDFYRKRFIYQLTRAGEAAEEALGVYDEAFGRRGALQAVALHDIVTQLRAVLVLASRYWGGLRIASALLRRVPWLPGAIWRRMTTVPRPSPIGRPTPNRTTGRSPLGSVSARRA
ncbi:DUF2397 family protein [Streptomyces sp. NPDC058525]|uniref:DUF2397 family protein n=1 Tax=unclassified Streptomyces TaxID=2593676 RepID=UPI00365CFC41